LSDQNKQRDFSGAQVSDELDVATARFYKYIDASIIDEEKALWCYMKPCGRPNFSNALLTELIDVSNMIKKMPDNDRSGSPMLEYFILGSSVRHIFNLGGDLEFFCKCIKQGQREQLQAYARVCIDALYTTYIGFEKSITTIALVQGEALGGGFEAALSCEVIISEEGARFGFPEVLFNLFPGMGAYSFLARRIGGGKAHQMVLSGKVFSAEEMNALGIVDVLVKAGDGEKAVHAYIARNRSKRRACSAFSKARRQVNPVTRKELCDIADIWVDAAFQLSEQDLRRMTRIATAQTRYC